MFSFLGIPSVIAAVLNFLGTISPIILVVLKPVVEALTWFFREFWKGLQVILSNLSTLTVIAVCVGIGGWYFRTWDNPKLIRECEQKIERIQKSTPKKPTPSKPGTSRVESPLDWRPW